MKTGPCYFVDVEKTRYSLPHESPEIWPLKAVVVLVLCIIAVSAACAVIAQKAEAAAGSVMERVEQVVARMDVEQEKASGVNHGRGAARPYHGRAALK